MTIYDQALQAIKDKQLSAELYTSATRRVFLKQINGDIKLIYQEIDAGGFVRKVETVDAAIFMPNRGWVFTLDRDTYERWVKRTGNGFKPVRKLQSLAEWAATPGGQAYMDQAPDSDLLAEIGARDAARVATRHPAQPVYAPMQFRSAE